jgi:hypothetical protein
MQYTLCNQLFDDDNSNCSFLFPVERHGSMRMEFPQNHIMMKRTKLFVSLTQILYSFGVLMWCTIYSVKLV